MKKTLLFIAIGIIICSGLFLLMKRNKSAVFGKPKMEKSTSSLPESVLGVYRINDKVIDQQISGLKHVYYKWSGDSTVIWPESASISNSPVFVTVEMWPEDNTSNFFQDLIRGQYDDRIKQFCSKLSANKNKIYLRWNPEMEVPVKRYPWQNQSPAEYREAFIHVSKIYKNLLPGVKIAWGPAGYAGALEYYPGDEAVDFISVTLQSASEKLTNAYPAYKSASAEIERKIHRMRFVDKPVIILGPSPSVSDSLQKEIKMASQSINQNKATMYGTAKKSGAKTTIIAHAQNNLKLGVVDPKKELNQQKEVTIEHLFLDWSGLQDGSFRKMFNEVIVRKHDVIVTLEPWKEKSGKPDSNVLQSTVNGRYDEQLRELYRIISNIEQTVYLRWAHEMEIPIKRYAWQSKSPVDYIKAFRHVAMFDKLKTRNVKMVWGPAGDRGSLEWWPGDDVVDYISIAIYGLPDKNITDHTKQESFESIYKRKSYRMRFVDKPIFITEFGIKGPEDYQRDWLKAAAKTINNHPEIKGVCYFNLFDTQEAWGNIEAPDWSVSKETFRSFIKSLDFKNTDNRFVSK